MKDEQLVLPEHVGFILDGNRRWAQKYSLPEYDGHLAGYHALREVMEGCFDRGIKYVTIFAFSSENWKRDKTEVSNLMKIALQAISKDLKNLVKRNVRVRILGRREGIDAKLLAGFAKCEEMTRHLTGPTFAVCFNYGGQQEIVDAARKCVQDGLVAEEISEEAITARLYAPEIPLVDMVIRTSGEQRLSNFMIWRTAYSEFYFLNKFWPEMTKEDVDGIINEYSRRSRRFGG